MSITRPWYAEKRTKPLVQTEFSANGATHTIELNRQSALEYVIQVDGEAHSTISASGVGFKKKIVVFSTSCTISGFNLGGFYNRYAIEVKQSPQTG